MPVRDISADILYEDNHLLAVNKRTSDIVQGDKTGDIPLTEAVKAYIKKKYHKPGDVFVGLIHRLDRPVSGVLLFARTSKALSRMNEMLRQGGLHKSYLAVVDALPPEEQGLLVHHLRKNATQNKSYVVKPGTPGAKEARLKYQLLSSGKKYHLLEIELLTGRHHQIRAQLAAIGCHIKGDLKYGSRRSNKDGSISLHARQVHFVHPVKKIPLSLQAPLPEAPEWSWFEGIM